MFGKSLIVDMISRSAETPTDRRNFLRGAGLAGLGAVGAGIAGTAGAGAASAATPEEISDAAILNFALNLEYLEAEFYSIAALGKRLDGSLVDGKQAAGTVTGGRAVAFKDPKVKAYATEIANDEVNHVKFLRDQLGAGKVARPNINLEQSFTDAARAAKVVGPTETFDPFSSDEFFLLGAYIFEDVGVTAYKGAAPLINNKTYLGAAAGILAVEAYHAGLVRSQLYRKGVDVAAITNLISDARDSLDGSTDIDQGVLAGRNRAYRANLVPTDGDSIVFKRDVQQTLNIVYLSPQGTPGGFFPNGANT